MCFLSTWAEAQEQNAPSPFLGVQDSHAAPHNKVTLGQIRSMCCKTVRRTVELDTLCIKAVRYWLAEPSRARNTAWPYTHASTGRRGLPFWGQVLSSFKKICRLEGCRHFLLNQALCFSICICQILFLQCIYFFKANPALFYLHICLCYMSLFVREMNNILQAKA